MISPDDETESLSQTNDNDDTDAAIDRLSGINGNRVVDETWLTDGSSARAARLQADEALVDSERSKRRNDALFLGKFSIDMVIVSLDKLSSVVT